MLRVLPEEAAGELLAGLAGFWACGFHAHRWEDAFRACYADRFLAELAGTDAAPPSFVSSLSSDHAGLLSEAASASVPRRWRPCGPRPEGAGSSCGSTGSSSPRHRPAECWPSRSSCSPTRNGGTRWCTSRWCYPSRQGLADYLAYGAEVTHTAERINHAFGTATWTPIVLHVEDDRPRSLASLTIFDVLLVNPVRDGSTCGQGGLAAQRRRGRAGPLP